MPSSLQHLIYDMNVSALNAAPTNIGVGTPDSGNGAIAPTIPATAAGNDVLIACVQSANEAITAPTNVGGTNWTSLTWAEIDNSPQNGTVGAAQAGSVRLGIFWLRIPASGTTVGTISIADTGNHTVGVVSGYRGCVTSGNPWDVTTGSAGGAIANNAWATLPNVTTTVGNTLIQTVVANSFDSTSSPWSATVSDWTATNIFNPTTITMRGEKNVSTGTGGGVGLILPINNTWLQMASVGSLSTGGNGNTSGIVDPAINCSASGACNWVAITIAFRSN